MRKVASIGLVVGLVVGFGPALSACSSPEPVFANWPAEDVDVLFLITRRGTRVIEQVGPLTLGETAATTRRLEDDDELLALGWSFEDLRALNPTFDDARATSLFLSDEPEACIERGQLFESRRSTRYPLPSSSRSFGWRPEDEMFAEDPSLVQAIESWSLEIPTGKPPCLETPERKLRPFGLQPRFLAPDDRLGGTPVSETSQNLKLTRISRLDPDRLLAVSHSALFLFDRRVPFEDTPSSRVLVSELDVTIDYIMDGLAVGTSTSAGQYRVSFILRLGVQGSSRIVSVSLGSSGFGAPRLSPLFEDVLTDIAVLADGTLVAVGDRLIIYGSESKGWQSLPAPAELRRVVIGPAGKIIVGGLGAFVGQVDLESDPPTIDNLSVPGDDGQALFGFPVTAIWWGPSETLWVMPKGGGRRVRKDGGWTRVPAFVPSEFNCGGASDGCGRTEIVQDVFVGEAQPLLYSNEACGRVVLERSEGCTAVLETVEGADGEPPGMLYAADASPFGAVFSGTDTLIWELEP